MALTKPLAHFYFEATFLFEYIFVYLNILKSLLLLNDLVYFFIILPLII